MYEKTMQHRVLVLMAAAIAVLLLMLLDNIQFMSSMLGAVDDSPAGYALYFITFALVCGVIFLPGVYLLRRERIPNALLINIFGLCGGAIATLWTSWLPMSVMGVVMFVIWCTIFAFYMLGYEIFTQLGRKQAWLIAGVIAIVGSADSIARIVFRVLL